MTMAALRLMEGIVLKVSQLAGKPNFVPAFAPCGRFGEATIIPLGRRLLAGSSDLPGDVRLRRSESGSGGPPDHATLFGLAPCGVLPATRVTTSAVRSYRTFSPLPRHSAVRRDGGRYIFCATVRQVTLPGRYPAHCPSEFGLSFRLRPSGFGETGSPRPGCESQRSSGQLRRFHCRMVLDTFAGRLPHDTFLK